MISLQKVGDAIKFTFQDNPLYLNDGTIEVPVNSLSLLIDESDIATFKKSNGDAFLCCSLDELNMTKEQLIAFYKDNMVGDDGMTPEEVEDIVESATTNLFGYAEYDSQNTRINFKHDANGSVISYIDASDFVIDGMIDNVEIVTVQGVKYLKITFNTDSGKEPILIPLSDIFNPNEYYTKTEVNGIVSDLEAVDSVISGAVDNVSSGLTTEAQRALSAETALDEKIDTKADANSVYTKTEVDNAISAATSGKVDTDVFEAKERVIAASLTDLDDRKLDASAYTPTDLSNYYTKSETDDEIEEAVSGKADTSAVTEAITAAVSGKSDTVELTQAEYDALVDKDPNTFYIISDAYPININNYYTKSETDGKITAAVSGKQDTLVSGTNIKTINNTSILGSGNIDIQGGGVNVVQTTGTSTTDVMSQDAVTTQLNNKADKSTAGGGLATSSANNYDILELSNQNGQSIIGHYKQVSFGKINGKRIIGQGLSNPNSFSLVETSAITTSVTSASTDSQVPSAKAVNDKLGGLSLVKLTKAEYDALATKDSNTLYIVTDN